MANSIKILHAADLHLDSPFEGLGEEKAAKRRSEMRDLLGRIAELANRSGAQVVLLAGDLFDSESAYRETGEALCAALGEINAPVFISPGNHDPYSAKSAYARLALPENVHVFRENKIECVPLPQLNARIWGAGFTESSAEPLLRGFEAEKDGDTLDIMVIHGDVGAGASAYNPISEDDLARSGMDYVALGHIHTYSGLLRAGETYYAYPGCAEGRGFDECGEKGVILAEVSHEASRAVLVPTCGRRYELLEVPLSADADPVAAVNSALPEDTSRDIYRITFTGECAEAPDLRAAAQALENKFFSLQLRDRTVLRRDLWERCGEDTLRGLFLTRLRREYDAAQSDDEREKIVLAARYGLAALDNGEGPAL